jgi:PTS system mannose-specific IID component
MVTSTPTPASTPAPDEPPPPRQISAWQWWATFVRLFAVQGSWNYETMLGNGIAFCAAPLLRTLPAAERRAATARQAQYFNAHPYLASVAVGAMARAELDGEDPARIERFRTAACGPLGSVGDQLVWAGWLPLCSLIALGAYGLGAAALPTICIFLGLYNAGHLALRAWGLRVGLTHGLRVATALANPVLRQGPRVIAFVAAPLAGIAIPLALQRAIGPGRELAGAVVVAAILGAASLAALTRGRAQGWRVAFIVLAGFVFYSVVR